MKNMKYTCADYREEMLLISLKNRLSRQDISENEKRKIIEKIKKLEKKMGLD